MTMTTTLRLSAFLLLGVTAACSSSSQAGSDVAAAPCDGKTIQALAADLEKANGLGIDLTDAKAKAEIEPAKAKLLGKKLAFTGCTFESQGNDQVTFGAEGTDAEIGCAMKGGEAAVKEFRHAAMEKERGALRLDVRGVIAPDQDSQFKRLGLRECTITVR